MSLQGPLIVISETAVGRLLAQLNEAGAFPIIETRWVESVAAITSVQPAAVLIAELGEADAKIADAFARRISLLQPYVPVLARVNEQGSLPFPSAIPIAADLPPERLIARLSTAMRVRELHATVLRRLELFKSWPALELAKTDPLLDATVLVLGRGGSYPALSVAVGEQVGIIGAFSIESASRCLAARDIDGVVIGDGFSPKIVDAFLLVLADDPRFRDLPVGVLGDATLPEKMPCALRAAHAPGLVTRILPLVRLHAFKNRLIRMLQSIERGGLLDPVTGLFTEDAFAQDLTDSIAQASVRGSGLCLARFSFETPLSGRAAADTARVVSRLMRKVDFACRQQDGSILAVFTGCDLRTAHVAARRLASVLKHTMLRAGDERPASPNITLAALKPNDTLLSLLARVVPRPVAAE